MFFNFSKYFLQGEILGGKKQQNKQTKTLMLCRRYIVQHNPTRIRNANRIQLGFSKMLMLRNVT